MDPSSLEFVDTLIARMPFRTLEVLEEDLETYGAAGIGTWSGEEGMTRPCGDDVIVVVPEGGTYFQRCYHRAHELGHLIAHAQKMRDMVMACPKGLSDGMVEVMRREGDSPREDEEARVRYQDRYLREDDEDPEREFVATWIAAGMLFPQMSSDDGEVQQLLWGRHSEAFLRRVAEHYQFSAQEDWDRYLELVRLVYRRFEMMSAFELTKAMADREGWLVYCKRHDLNPNEPFSLYTPIGEKWHHVFPPFEPDPVK